MEALYDLEEQGLQLLDVDFDHGVFDMVDHMNQTKTWGGRKTEEGIVVTVDNEKVFHTLISFVPQSHS